MRVVKIENSLNIVNTRLWKDSSLTNLGFNNIQGWNPHNIHRNPRIYTKILRIYNENWKSESTHNKSVTELNLWTDMLQANSKIPDKCRMQYE